MQTKRNVFLWALYDFANSVVSIVFFLYFAQWVVIDRGLPDLYFNLTSTVAAVLLLLTVPLTSFLLGTYFRRITGLRCATGAIIIFYGLCAASVIAGKEMFALLFFAIGMYAYLLTFSFYTPLLRDISSPEHRGRVSGIGITANYLGQFTGLLIALPFSNGTFAFFGAGARAETLLPAVALFAVLALPMLLFFKEPKKESRTIALRIEIRNWFTKTKAVFTYPSVGLFLLAYFLFNDAVLTAAQNFPIFMEQVWGLSDTVKTYVLLSIIITSAIGGTVSGLIADRFGHKRTLLYVLGGWIIILPLVGMATNFTVFVVATTVMGFWLGANWTVSRSVMAYLAPQEGHNLAFGYFGLVERASAFVGPIVWGVVLSSLVSIGPDRYRIATLAVTLFVVFGLLVLTRVRGDVRSASSL